MVEWQIHSVTITHEICDFIIVEFPVFKGFGNGIFLLDFIQQIIFAFNFRIFVCRNDLVIVGVPRIV